MNRLLTVAILSISMITVMASAAVSPALANISNAFPEASSTLIKTILTLPSLFIIPFSLISGIFVKKYGNKRILLLGIIVYIFGGIAPVFVNSIYELLFFRAILGCGCGLIMPISQSLIALNFEGTLRTKITGYSAAASYLMGIIASFVVAPVSSINWHYSFYIYTIAVVVLVLNIIALPNDKPLDNKKTDQKRFPSKVWFIILGMFLVNIAFYAVPANIALFMKEQSIGSAESAGIVISAFMISGFIAGIILSNFQKWFRKYTVAAGVGIMALGYIILAVSYNIWYVIAGAALVGFSFGILFPVFLVLINNTCSSNSIILALSFSSCAQFLGQFLSPYILQLLKVLLGLESLRNDFNILSVALFIVFVLSVIFKRTNRSVL